MWIHEGAETFVMDNPQANENQVNVPDHGAMMAVVSGDSEGASDDEDIFDTSNARTDPKHSDDRSVGDESLYDDKLDDEDEEYVYMNLRGGKHDPSSEEAQGNKTAPRNHLKKPRNSDAIISCPACFSTLSMDTQRHYKYQNQYRAMFVMGITVDWQHQLKYDDKVAGLVRYYPTPSAPQGTQIVAPDNQAASSNSEDPIYYATFCANCRTLVAALDMTDEVYHFYDCLASS